MLGMDPYWILSEALLLITFILLIVTYILLPSRKDVRAGVKKVPGWIPGVHVIMFVLSGAIIGVSLTLVEKYLIIMSTGIILMIAILLAFIDYFITRAQMGRTSAEDGVIHHAVELTDHTPDHTPHQTHPVHHAPHHPQSHSQEARRSGPMMTLECPQCGGHIQMPEGSHHITCPYCGLSGTL